MEKKIRCAWAKSDSESYCRYHDEEWGVPVHDDRELFEFLVLEGAQAGLSWSTILAKREGYRKAFANFDCEKVAAYSDNKLEALHQDPTIVRNRLKVSATRENARQFIQIQSQFGSFDNYIWSFTDHKVIQNSWEHVQQVPASTPLSDVISKDLKKRGFKFVGTTIMYAFMQATGMVNDHTTDCFRHHQLQ